MKEEQGYNQKVKTRLEPVVSGRVDRLVRHDRVRIKNGASAWMQKHGYWLPDMGTNIDGCYGTITDDYTDLLGNDSHYGVNIGFDFIVGVNPIWLEVV